VKRIWSELVKVFWMKGKWENVSKGIDLERAPRTSAYRNQSGRGTSRTEGGGVGSVFIPREKKKEGLFL